MCEHVRVIVQICVLSVHGLTLWNLWLLVFFLVQANFFVFNFLQNPDYMKENFNITITTVHIENDRGRLENVRSVETVEEMMW